MQENVSHASSPPMLHYALGMDFPIHPRNTWTILIFHAGPVEISAEELQTSHKDTYHYPQLILLLLVTTERVYMELANSNDPGL